MSPSVTFLQTYSDKVVNFAVEFVSTKIIILKTVLFNDKAAGSTLA